MDRLVPVETFFHQAIERGPDRNFVAERDLIFDEDMHCGVRLHARHPDPRSPMIALCEPDTLRLVERQPLLRLGRFKGIVVSQLGPFSGDHSKQIGWLEAGRKRAMVEPDRARPAFFINIGRGFTTRFADLAAALEAGEIAGAGLDVFEQEPLPPGHPLWTMPGVLLTPHTAGYGPYLDDRRYEIILDNCRRFLAGRPLRNLVDKARWF